MRLEKLARGLGAVAIVGVLSVTMVYEAGPAQADVVDQATLLLKAAAGGGMGLAAVSPSMVEAGATVCATGVGCAVLAVGAAAAVGLYLTRDSWMPYLANGWGVVTQQAGWSQGKGYRMTVDGASTATAFVVTAERQRATNYWEEDLFISVRAEGDYWCTNGYTGWTSVIVNIPDAAGGNMGYYYKDTPDAQSLPVTQTMGDVGNCAAFGRGTTVGFRGGATAPRVGTVQSWTDLQWGTANVAPASTQDTRLKVQCKNPDGSDYEVIGPPTITGPGTPIPDNGVIQPACYGGASSPSTASPGAVGKCVTLQGRLIPGGDFSDLSGNCGASAASDVLYPNCVGAIACTYVIRVNGRPCTIGGEGCADWPARAETNPQNYGCYYGPYAIGLAGCNMLERAYEPINGTQPLTATAANTDGDPRTNSAPAPVIDPPTTPRVAPAPVGTPVPDVPGGPMPIVPVEGQDCFPSGVSAFNPVSWVLQPVKCALKWAFVPDAATLAGPVTDFQATWGSKPPGSLVNGTAAVFGSLGTGWNGGCSGAASADFSGAPGHPLRLPCEPAGAGAGSIPFTAMQIALIVSTVIAVWHMVGAGISAHATGES